MSIQPTDVKTIAPLRNVALMMGLVERLRTRTPGLPGIGVLHGFSGYGKSLATTYTANKLRGKAAYVEVRSSWTRKTLMEALLVELGEPTRSATVATMVDKAAEALMRERKVLFVDEADHVADRGMLELVRDLHDIAGTPIVLIGEEGLPRKIERFERVHNRVLAFEPALPCDRADARHLAKLYCGGIDVADELLDHLVAALGGCTRRVATNLDLIRETAMVQGWSCVDRAAWGDRPLNTGKAVIRPRGAQ